MEGRLTWQGRRVGGEVWEEFGKRPSSMALRLIVLQRGRQNDILVVGVVNYDSPQVAQACSGGRGGDASGVAGSAAAASACGAALPIGRGKQGAGPALGAPSPALAMRPFMVQGYWAEKVLLEKTPAHECGRAGCNRGHAQAGPGRRAAFGLRWLECSATASAQAQGRGSAGLPGARPHRPGRCRR